MKLGLMCWATKGLPNSHRRRGHGSNVTGPGRSERFLKTRESRSIEQERKPWAFWRGVGRLRREWERMSLLDRSTTNPVDSPGRGYKAQARLMKSCSWPTAARPMWNTAQLAASRIGAATRMSLRSMVAGESCWVILRNGAGPSRRRMGIDRFRCTGCQVPGQPQDHGQPRLSWPTRSSRGR